MALFYHSGECGDVIYSLPAMRALGGGIYYLNTDPRSGPYLSAAKAAALLPLLDQQPGVFSVGSGDQLKPQHCNFNLDGFRKYADYAVYGFNVLQMYFRAFDLPFHLSYGPWLSVQNPLTLSRVVINRTARHQNPAVSWPTLLDMFCQNTIPVFVGTDAEYTDFLKAVPEHIVRYQPTDNFLEAARIIAGADLFMGNQSACLAIAEGLKKPMVVEACAEYPNCYFHRNHATYFPPQPPPQVQPQPRTH